MEIKEDFVGSGGPSPIADWSLTRLLLIVAGIVALMVMAVIFALPGKAHAGALSEYAVGVNGIWADQKVYPTDFELGGNGALSMSPHLSLVAAGFYGFNHSYIRGSGGFRITASDANDPNFSVGIGGQYHVSSEEASRPQEFAADASIGYKPWPAEQPRLLLIAQGQYGFKHHDAEAIAGVRYSLGKEYTK